MSDVWEWYKRQALPLRVAVACAIGASTFSLTAISSRILSTAHAEDTSEKSLVASTGQSGGRTAGSITNNGPIYNAPTGPQQLPTAIFGAPIGGEAPDFRAPLARESNL